MSQLLASFLQERNRKVRELDQVFDALVSIADAGDVPIPMSGKVKRQLWRPSDIPPAGDLKAIFDAIEEALGEPLLRGDSARKIIPSMQGRNNEFHFRDVRFRFALTRIIRAGLVKILNVDSIRAKEARDLARELEERAESRIYYSVTRRFYRRYQNENQYKNWILFYVTRGSLLSSSLRSVEKRTLEYMRKSLGVQSVDFEVIKRPLLTTKPSGYFHKYGDRLRPGVSLQSPGGMWSSLACLARDPATNVIYAVCSGHGATDYYTAEVGDTLGRRVAANRDEPVALLARLPEYAVVPDADLPIIDYDFALAEVIRPHTAENFLEDDGVLQKVDRMRTLDSKEFEGAAVHVTKVGAITQRQVGRVVNNRMIVNVVDEFGNAKILLDQIEIRKSGSAFARLGDSGGLIFQQNPADARSVIAIAAITATGGLAGEASVTFAAPLERYLEANKLELLGGVL